MSIVKPEDMDGEGCFKCPQCGEVISPDEENDLEYIITEVDEDHRQIKLRHKCGAEVKVKFEGIAE